MADWYILSDIPYQKDFPPLIKITKEPGTYSWNILTDIPYMPIFPELYAVNEYPLNPDIWFINKDIPYHKEFPPLIAINNEPGISPWYIQTDIPYMHEFPAVQAIDERPLNPDIRFINKDIPYHKEFPRLYRINDKPLSGRYILEDIPYQKDFPELVPINAKPSSGWYILNGIPYQKGFPSLYAIDDKPFIGGWILNDIPYQKKFPKLYPIDDKPTTWYILYDIPYMKEFPPLYPIEPIPLPHYMYYFTVGTAAVGRWQIRKTRLKANMPPPEEWTLIEDLGPPTAVLSACIEADGDFDYIAGNDSITLTTTDTPWMAVITTTKKLYVKQVCADIETAILLDTGVEQASLCRGWKSDKYSVDSGLICAYRKSNGVYAKVYKKVNGEYVWETLPQLLYEPVEHVEVKRLNDYRIGVYVTNPNRLLLSERFYIGGTSKTEYIYTKIVSWVNIATARMNTEPAHQDFTFVSATIENQKYIRVHGKYPIYSIDRDVTNVTFNDSYKHSKMVSYTINNGDILIEMDNPKLNAWNTLSITFTTYNHIKYVAGESRTGVVPEQTITVPNDFVPKEYINLTMGSAVSELKTVEMQNYKISMPKEMISMSMSSTVSELITTEVQRKQYNAKTETIILSMNSAVSELQTTQVGDLPV